MENIRKRGPDFSAHGGGVRAVKLVLCRNHDYTTFIDECSCQCKKPDVRFAIIGTSYGWLHNIFGDIQMYRSRTSAVDRATKYKAMNYDAE